MDNSMNNKKTVYIIGAGFSVEAGAPTQAKIIQHAFELHNANPDDFDKTKFNIFTNFISQQLNVSEENFATVDLEDIFTPLDRCLAESSQFRGINLGSIMKVREAVFYVVGTTIQLLLNNTNDKKDYIDKFANYLTKKSSIRANASYRSNDPVSVISTNWDILLDNSIYEALHSNTEYNGVVDYCCYISSKDVADKTVVPGLEKLGQGGFNVKLLKLHGSLNWLQCPRCARLYAKFFEKQSMNNFANPSSCRHCDSNFPEEDGKHELTPNLIMPTYLKDLSNPQYRIIWQNAGIELSEADEIVFIGYSLPYADFEMRQLLSRMTRKTAKIHVVDKPAKEDIEKLKAHWKKFFGNREINFSLDGAKSFIKNL
jgi:NAD-dependent SIR2 family protein deacetylase